MNNVTRFRSPGGEELVVLSARDYETLLDAAEERGDVAAFDRAMDRLAAGKEEMLPADMVKRILAGENSVRVWREHRGLSVTALAQAAGLSQPYVSQIEAGARQGTKSSLDRLAMALGVDPDDLSP